MTNYKNPLIEHDKEITSLPSFVSYFSLAFFLLRNLMPGITGRAWINISQRQDYTVCKAAAYRLELRSGNYVAGSAGVASNRIYFELVGRAAKQKLLPY